jgi:hypothetical protein
MHHHVTTLIYKFFEYFKNFKITVLPFRVVGALPCTRVLSFTRV